MSDRWPESCLARSSACWTSPPSRTNPNEDRKPLYKTICLHLLEDRPQLHEQLRQTRTLLPTLDRLAGELKASHEAWMDRLSQTGSSEQISSEALELALKELVDSLPSESPPDEEEFPLDAAMAFISRL